MPSEGHVVRCDICQIVMEQPSIEEAEERAIGRSGLFFGELARQGLGYCFG